MQSLWLGTIDHHDLRAIQARYIQSLLAEQGEEVLLFCEHNPVLTLGKRSQISSQQPYSYFVEREIPIVRVERGGEATYHGPGQLLIYPVINLRSRRMGVRAFVELGLAGICRALRERFDLAAEIDLEQAGVWVRGSEARLKIASVGLRIRQGITDYGFSLNINCDLEPFRHFSPCGISGNYVTSINEQGAKARVDDEIMHRALTCAFLGEKY